uniref:Replication factor C subunit 2/4 n=2 Tax=Tetraselmis sp. GSL018 TaxID=582737 RepID=A0A061RFM7_9CHLO
MPGGGQPWVEKYRPRKIAEVAFQEDVVNTLKAALETANLPHLLFYGPPGTGKTSTALAIAHQLFGPELFKSRVMELNASDERGIGVVRNKIKGFAAQAVGPAAPGYPCPPFKLLILDEADSMTPDAQNALRRTMETYSRVTRFCFCCNYVSRIIEPLASRCAKFRFKPFGEAVMSERILHICGSEGVSLEEGAMACLGKVSGGDLRKAITTLQSAVRLGGKDVKTQTIIDVAAVVPSDRIDQLIAACRSGSFRECQDQINGLMAEGWPAQQILLQVQEAVLAAEAIPDAKQGKVFELLAAADKQLVDGADESLQLLNVASGIQRVLSG